MRKVLISILLATAVTATPALAAQDRDNEARPHWGDHQESHPDRGQGRQQQQVRDQGRQEQQQARDQGHADRSNGGGNFVRQQPMQDSSRGFDRSRFERGNNSPAVQHVQEGDRGGFDRSRFERPNPGPRVVEAPQQGSDWSDRRSVRDDSSNDRGDWTRDRGQQSVAPGGWTRTRNGWARTGGNQRRGDRLDPNAVRSRNPVIVNNDQYRDHNRWASGGWNRDWRHEHRYDWRNYRQLHRSIFRLGIYFDPFGYGYRTFNIGYRLLPAYYGQQYWFDPQMYSLPYPPPGTEWVRYWNDALLVDIYSGEVVDVIHNFFW